MSYKPLPDPKTFGSLPEHIRQKEKLDTHDRIKPDDFDLRIHDNQEILIHIYNEIERLHDRITDLYHHFDSKNNEIERLQDHKNIIKNNQYPKVPPPKQYSYIPQYKNY
ncbi:MAG: hypothetical protein LBR15_06340 [Methanobrevibacter sp.]|jgi:hypothetical protein|nr:hypothetical protein [Candidatus Methanovirga australis]